VPLDAHKRRPGRDEVTKRRQHLKLDIRSAREIDQTRAVNVEQYPRSGGAENARGVLPICQLLGIQLVELMTDLITDGLDQRPGSQLAPDVVHVQHQHHDADDDENEGDHDGNAWHKLVAFRGAHLAQRQHRVCECPDKDANRELAGLVLQNGGDDSGRELTHCELNDH
jgi:hypothetical protein